MTDGWILIIVIGGLLAGLAAFIWVALRLGKGGRGSIASSHDDLLSKASVDVESVFNNEFREELRNRGRLHFEKIIGENAMFLQQDLRLTTSQLNDYMKQEIAKTLQEEFTKYEESIADAKQIAVSSIEKTQAVIEQHRQMLSEQLEEQITAQKAQVMEHFVQNMAEIINHYILDAIGTQIDLTDQLEYILAELEKNKEAILEDVKNGA